MHCEAAQIKGPAFRATNKSVQHHQKFCWRLICVVKRETPVYAMGNPAHGFTLARKFFHIGIAQGFGLAREIFERAIHVAKFNAAIIGKRLLRRIDDLHEVAGDAAGCEGPHCCCNVFGLLKEVTEEHDAGEFLQMLGLGQACPLIAQQPVAMEPARTGVLTFADCRSSERSARASRLASARSEMAGRAFGLLRWD